MIPDGGISRFRVYGTVEMPPVGSGISEMVVPEHPELHSLDLAHMLNGARVVLYVTFLTRSTSDQHFGVGANLLLPGRGKDMGDGWETKRSRTPGHRDWVVVQLAEPGVLSHVDVDTLHFLGNFPESIELHGCLYTGTELVPPGHQDLDSDHWFPLVPRSKMGPGRIHELDVITAGQQRVTSHVRLTMHPDGGIKRLRVYGRRASELTKAGIDVNMPLALSALPPVPRHTVEQAGLQVTQAEALTPQSFAPYGQVVSVPASNEAPGGVKRVNQGTALKHCELAHVVQEYPNTARVQTNVHVYVSDARGPRSLILPFRVHVLERHKYTTQLFFPVSPPAGARTMGQEGYLVIVALPGADQQPDLATLKAFWAESDQGISYSPGVWHHPLIAAGITPTSFVCVVNECPSQPELDVDEVFYA